MLGAGCGAQELILIVGEDGYERSFLRKIPSRRIKNQGPPLTFELTLRYVEPRFRSVVVRSGVVSSLVLYATIKCWSESY